MDELIETAADVAMRAAETWLDGEGVRIDPAKVLALTKEIVALFTRHQVVEVHARELVVDDRH